MSTLKGLPFKVSREDANKRFAENVSLLSANNTKSSTTNLAPYESDPVTECFVPFHSADVSNLSAVFDGKYGKDRTEYYFTTKQNGDNTETVLESRTVTDWYDCSGILPTTRYPFGTKQTQLYADFIYPRKIVEKALQSGDVIQASALPPNNQSKIIHPHTMTMAMALERLNARLYDLEKERAEHYIRETFNADDVRINDFEIYLDQAEFRLFSYHVPAYVYITKSSGYTSHTVLNGYNGQLYGKNILSVLNTSIAGGFVGAAVGLIIGFASPQLRLGQFILRPIIGYFIAMPLSAFYARWHNASLEFEFVDTKNDEKYNQQFVESDEDRARRADAYNNSKETEHTFNQHHQFNLPVDKCKLLGLDPAQEITIEQVHVAYRKQMKKWHPDLFRSQQSKKQAEEMAKQINIAHDELTNLFNKSKSR